MSGPSPTASMVAATNTVKPPHNWASVQLNLIMLPVGLSLLVILSLTACLCNFLRKRRLKRLERELKRQRKNTEIKHHNDVENGGSFINFGSSPTHNGYPGLPREKSFSPKNRVSPTNDHTHPAIIKKEGRKQKRRLKRSMSPTSYHIEKESSVKYVRESKTPDRISNNNGISRNDNIASGSTTSGSIRTKLPGNQVSGIPVAMKPKSRESKRNRSLSLESNPTLKSNQNRHTVDMELTKSSKDRRKWEIPETRSIEYDKKGSLRLPPLSELRTAKSA